MPSASALLKSLVQLPAAQRYWVAYSGGLDSQVLLHLLAKLQAELPASLGAIHINHGLQAQANAWQAFCEQSCAELGVELQVRQLKLKPAPGESLEAQARQARYAAFSEMLQPNDMLLTAHHLDDQAETVLLHLLRGSGVDGLSAMPLCRQWARGWHARPMLDWSREQLSDLAGDWGLQWIEDPSNQDQGFDRNYLRHKVMPLLKERWPAASRGLARSAQLLGQARTRLEQEDAALLETCCNREGRLQIEPLNGFAPAIRVALVRLWLRRQQVSTPPHKRLDELLQQLSEGPTQSLAQSRSEMVWGSHSVRAYRGELWLLPQPLPEQPLEALAWKGQFALCLPTGLGTLSWQGEPLDAGHRLSVTWYGPDTADESLKSGCRMPGREGRRTLRKLYQQIGVPPWQRPYVPLLLIDGELAAVGDYCVCDCANLPRNSDWALHWQRPGWLQLGGASAE